MNNEPLYLRVVRLRAEMELAEERARIANREATAAKDAWLKEQLILEMMNSTRLES